MEDYSPKCCYSTPGMISFYVDTTGNVALGHWNSIFLRLLENLCQLMGLSSIFTSAIHQRMNGQLKHCNKTLLSMPRSYVNEQQNDLDVYHSAHTYAYNNRSQRPTRTVRFKLVLSLPSAAPLLHRSVPPQPALD